MGFDHRLQVLQDFTSDGDKIGAALGKLKPGSTSSRMVDAVIESARMLRKQPPNRRRVLLLISETRDHGSEGKVREALTDLQFDNISVYSVNINRLVGTLLAKPEPPRPDAIPPTARNYPGGVPPTPSNAAQMSGNATNSANFVPAFVEIFKQVKGIFIDNPVEVFTKFTGGRERSFVTQRDLENAITGVGSELHSEYMITYTPNNKDEGGYHTIQVSIPGRDDVKIRTRPGYWIASKN
jgi:VWFA-related protein